MYTRTLTRTFSTRTRTRLLIYSWSVLYAIFHFLIQTIPAKKNINKSL